ncbi:MAG: glycosyltransferase family 4 protein [Chloroflexi bacterium]|nr:glycosyltransferase family 4 protein [Chloroflexota bacterium]
MTSPHLDAAPRPRVLEVATADYAARFLLLPLIDRLRSDGFEVAIVCNNGQFSKQMEAWGYNMISMELTRHLSPWHALRDLWRLYRLARRHQSEVIHLHTPITAVLGRIAARLARVKVIVYTAHGFPFHEGMRQPFRWAAMLMERVLSRWFTHLVLVQSREDYEFALARGIVPAHKLRWIGNGVDIHRFSPRDDGGDVRRELGLSESARIVGFIGRLVKEKGILELLNAMRLIVANMPEAHLLVVGDVLPSDRDQQAKAMAVDMADQEGLTGHVTFLGLRDDVHRLLGAVDVITLPSHREGFPRSIIEAMAAGKPVVATNIRGCREAVVDGETGFLVPVADIHALANSLGKLLSDHALAKRMGAQARERAVELFDEEKVLDREMDALSVAFMGALLSYSKTSS